MASPLVIGLHVGGTKILSGLVDWEGAVVAEHRVATPGKSQEEALAAMDAAAVELLDDRVAAIGYGIPANLERMAAGELVLGPAVEVARQEAIPPANETLRVVAAELDEDAGLVGFEALDGLR